MRFQIQAFSVALLSVPSHHSILDLMGIFEIEIEMSRLIRLVHTIFISEDIVQT